MAMLERIKKKQLEGFREFVISLETTAISSRGQIFTSGVLEDPMYMSWVMKNIRTFEDFLKLPADEIEKVLASQENIVNVFAKSIEDRSMGISFVESTIPRLLAKIKDEWEFLGNVTPEQRMSARSHIMKVTRKLQVSEEILGFRWQLPPMDIFYPKAYKDGLTEICFDSGVMAAKGMMERGQRVGPWVHYYDNGRILAQGSYLNGLKEGEWAFFYSTGKDRARGKYFGDQRHGMWKEWNRDAVVSEVEYNEGVKL